MKKSERGDQGSSRTSSQTPALTGVLAGEFWTLKRLKGGILFVIGYLLSPLCWWNDLVFNLPIAYGIGYLCSLVSSDWLLPGLIAGYWLSNVIGILMMQFGAMDALQQQSQPRNLKKDLLTGIISSTVYTLLILALVQSGIIDAPTLFPNENPVHLISLLPHFILWGTP